MWKPLLFIYLFLILEKIALKRTNYNCKAAITFGIGLPSFRNDWGEDGNRLDVQCKGFVSELFILIRREMICFKKSLNMVVNWQYFKSRLGF